MTEQPAGYQKNSVLAVVSLVLGLASFFFPIVCSLGAIITGHIARSEIRKGTQSGAGLAMAGLVLGYLTFVVPCLAIGTITLYGDNIHELFIMSADELEKQPIREFQPVPPG